MLSRITACILLCAALGACAPTYSIAVSDGGLDVSRPVAVTTAAALAPTEAAVAYSSEYAPPAENATRAVATNRVTTEVPEGTPYHGFIGLARSTAPQGVIMVGPPRLAQAGVAPSEAAKPVPPRLMVKAQEAQLVEAPANDVALAAVDSLAADTKVSAVAGRAVALGLQQDVETTGFQAAALASGAEGIAVSQSPLEPVKAWQPLAAEAARMLNSYQKVSSLRVDVLAEAAGAAYQTRVAREEADVQAARGAEGGTLPLAVDNAVGVDTYTLSRAAAVRTAVAAPQFIAKGIGADLLVKRMVVKDIGNARLLIAAETAEGWLVYRRVAVTRLLAVSKAPRLEESSQVPALGAKSSGAEALAGAVVPIEAERPINVLKPESTKTLAGYVNVRNLRKYEWVSAPRAVESASLAEVAVLKEARLIDGDEVRELTDAGVLKDRPLSPMIIGYRIHVFNPSSAAVAEVRVLDRLDPSTPLLVNSLSTNADDASATYMADERALEVTLPRLPSGGHFVVEFYVDVLAGK